MSECEPFSMIETPLRNRMRVELKASPAEVWTLVGDLARLPDYAAGLERVDAQTDANGRCVGFTCHFKPMEPGGDGLVSREVIRWYDPNHGYASSSADADAFGMSNDLNLVVLEPSADGTLLTIDEYFEAQDLTMMKAHFDEALSDIGRNLVSRFGGRMIHCYMRD